MEKTKIITTGIIAIWMLWTIALWFSFFWSETEQQLRSINNEVTMIETQILDNKAEWEKLQTKIVELQHDQLTYTHANDELRKQLDDLNNKKKSLGLN